MFFIRILREYERGVVFRLGRLLEPERARRRLPDPDRRPDRQGRPAHDHAQHPAAGSDHQGQRAGARERRRLLPDRRPEAAIVQIENFMVATSQIAQTTLRSVLGQHVLDELLVRAREDQRDPAGHHRRADRAVGNQGRDGRGEGRRDPRRRCSARWRGRRRPSASVARRSSTPRASSRPPSG